MDYQTAEGATLVITTEPVEVTVVHYRPTVRFPDGRIATLVDCVSDSPDGAEGLAMLLLAKAEAAVKLRGQDKPCSGLEVVT